MRICKDCIHYGICSEYVSPCESFPETDGCPCFKNKADVVEVVRCKDCIYYKSNCCFNRQWDFESSVEVPLVRENDFCSYGERREQNEG